MKLEIIRDSQNVIKNGKVQYEGVSDVVKDMRNYLVDYINTNTY